MVVATSRSVWLWVQKGLPLSVLMTAGGERNLTHLQLLFNITTPVVDIWSERKAGYGFLVMCLNRKKHYRYEMSKRQQG